MGSWFQQAESPARQDQRSGGEAGVDESDASLVGGAVITRRRGRQAGPAAPTTKPMEQMLWDAACSIRGEKDAPKFKDYLLPLLFLKRLSDVFDDEIDRLAEEYGARDVALQIADNDHDLLRFYLPLQRAGRSSADAHSTTGLTTSVVGRRDHARYR